MILIYMQSFLAGGDICLFFLIDLIKVEQGRLQELCEPPVLLLFILKVFNM